MKKISLLATLSFIILLGAGCSPEVLEQTKEENVLASSTAEEAQQQFVPETKKEVVEENKEPSSQEQGVTLYKGSWFDIYYPSNFVARPTEPVNNATDLKIPGVAPRKEVITDEAYFVSNDGSVEFFVFSPLWAGDPKNYLIVASNEELVNETIDEKKGKLIILISLVTILLVG